MFLLDGKRLQPGVAFTHEGTQYPANWLNLSTLEEKEAIGITEVAEEQRPNDKFYWVQDNNDGTYTATPKDLAGLKATLTSEVNKQAYSLLAPSDWLVTRAVEQGGSVPAAWATWRQEIRTQAQTQAAAIAAVTTVESLEALPAVVWVHDPDYVAPAQA